MGERLGDTSGVTEILIVAVRVGDKEMEAVRVWEVESLGSAEFEAEILREGKGLLDGRGETEVDLVGENAGDRDSTGLLEGSGV